MYILGVRIDECTRAEAQANARAFLQQPGQSTIVTPNPEMLVAAAADPDLKRALNVSSLSLCDGQGVAFAGKGKLTRIPGVEFMIDLCQIAAREGKNVFLLGETDLPKAAAALRALAPGLLIAGTHRGPKIAPRESGALNLDRLENDDVIGEIVLAAPDILFVGFGHGKQEKWIHDHLKELPSVKIAMGVGGAFDMIAGTKPRAPRWLRRLGMEWVWRLILEPRRWHRIWTAVIVFPYRYFTSPNH